MSIEDLHQLLLISSRDISDEYTRLFHGRGNTYNGYRFLTVDSVDKVLFAVLFEADEEEDAIISMIESFFDAEGSVDINSFRRKDGRTQITRHVKCFSNDVEILKEIKFLLTKFKIQSKATLI